MRLVIVGFGGQGKLALQIARELGISVIGFVNALDSETPREVNGVPILRSLDPSRVDRVIIALGDNCRKRELAIQYAAQGYKFATLVSPHACVSETVVIGAGSIVGPMTVVGSDCCVGGHVKVDSGCVLPHDILVEDFAALSPGVVFGGYVTVGEGTLIGVNAAIHPCIRIGAWSIVGIGAVVVRDVSDGITVLGNPAKTMRVHSKQRGILAGGIDGPAAVTGGGLGSPPSGKSGEEVAEQAKRMSLSDIVGGARQSGRQDPESCCDGQCPLP